MREGLASVADERTFFPVADIGQCEECLPQPFLMLQSILRACGGQLQNKKKCKSHRVFTFLCNAANTDIDVL